MTVARSSQDHSLVGMFCRNSIISSNFIFLNFLENLRMMAAKMQSTSPKQLLSTARQVSQRRRHTFMVNCRSRRQVTILKYMWQKSMLQEVKWLSSQGSTRLITSSIRTNDFWMPGHELVQLSRIPSSTLLRQQQESASMLASTSSCRLAMSSGQWRVQKSSQTCSERNTMMKGVTTSFIPCTQPLAGCLMCQTYNSLRMIFWIFSCLKSVLSGRVLRTSSLISLEVFFYWASCSRLGFSMQVLTMTRQSLRLRLSDCSWLSLLVGMYFKSIFQDQLLRS